MAKPYLSTSLLYFEKQSLGTMNRIKGKISSTQKQGRSVNIFKLWVVSRLVNKIKTRKIKNIMQIKSSITSVTFHFHFLFFFSAFSSSGNLTSRNPGDTPWPACSGDSAGHHDSGQMELMRRRFCGNGLGVRQRWLRRRCILEPDT